MHNMIIRYVGSNLLKSMKLSLGSAVVVLSSYQKSVCGFVTSHVYIDTLIVLLGLSVLSVQELNEMHEEMSAKFTRLSEDLIKELQKRDTLIRDQEVRNQFVASLMKVEGKKKAVSQAKAQVAANSSRSSKRLVLKAKGTLKKKGESSSDIINQCKVSHTLCLLVCLFLFVCLSVIFYLPK